MPASSSANTSSNPPCNPHAPDKHGPDTALKGRARAVIALIRRGKKKRDPANRVPLELRFSASLEAQLQGELNFSRIEGARRLTEDAAGDAVGEVRARRRTRLLEVGSVKRVEEVSTELQIHPLAEVGLLEEGEVARERRRALEGVAAHGSVATEARSSEEASRHIVAVGILLFAALQVVGGGGTRPVIANTVQVPIPAPVDGRVIDNLTSRRHARCCSGAIAVVLSMVMM